MSIIHFADTTSAAGGGGFQINLAGTGFRSSYGTSSASITYWFNNDGTTDITASGFRNQYNVGLDWAGAAGGTFNPAHYEIRGDRYAESSSTTVFKSGTARLIDDTAGTGWYNLGSTQYYTFTINSTGGVVWSNEFATASIRWEIRDINNPAANLKTSAIDGVTPIVDDSFNYYYQLESGTE